MVGTRTPVRPWLVAASPSSHCTPASPRLSVSAMHVRLCHRHEVRGAEEFAHHDLMLQGLLRDRAELARQNIPFFVVKFHCRHSIVAPESRTALPHLAISTLKLAEGIERKVG